METQKITLSLPKDVLLKVKLLAVERETSVSGLLADMLQRLVEHEMTYAHARERHLHYLAGAEDLGTEGEVGVYREALHECA